MSRDQERSFIAHISTPEYALEIDRRNPPKNILGTTFTFTYLNGVLVPVARSRKSIIPMKVHFWCYDDYYNIQILNGPSANMYLSKNDDGTIAALPAAGGQTTSYNLLDDGHNIITLDDLPSDTASVYLKSRNNNTLKINRSTFGHHFNDTSGEEIMFKLKIIERSPG